MTPPSRPAPVAHARAVALLAALVFVGIAQCGAPSKPAASSSPSAPASEAPSAGPVLEFALHPLCDDPCDDRETQGESRSLRGKRALVIVGTSYDNDTLINLRELAPLLTHLPADTQCLFVAKQPWADHAIVKYFFDFFRTPCRLAIADETEHRLGDLSQLENIPVLFILTPDGRFAGALAGRVTLEQAKQLLAKAGHSPPSHD